MPNPSRFNLLNPYLLSGIGVLVVLVIHGFLPSMLNDYQGSNGINLHWNLLLQNDFSASLCLDRLTEIEFKRRPLMYGAQIGLHRLGMSYTLSFLILWMTGFYSTSVLLYKNALLLGVSKNKSWIAIFLFFTHFSIVFAFLGNTSTYDEPLVYLLLALTLHFLLKKQLWFSLLVFIIACIGRESSFIFLPLICIYFVEKSIPQRLLFAVLSISAYLLFLYLYLPSSDASTTSSFLIHQRFLAWQTNFQTIYHSTESIIGAWSCIGLAFYILLKLYYLDALNTPIKKLIFSTLILIIFNTLLVFTGGLASEMRLFSLPLILGFSLMPMYFEHFRFNKPQTKTYLQLIGIAILSVVLIKLFYRASNSNVYAAYAMKAYVIVYNMIFVFILSNGRKKESNSLNQP